MSSNAKKLPDEVSERKLFDRTSSLSFDVRRIKDFLPTHISKLVEISDKSLHGREANPISVVCIETITTVETSDIRLHATEIENRSGY